MVRRSQTDHQAVAAKARQEPGVWTLAGIYRSSLSARGTASHIATGRLSSYEPASAFEAYSTATDDGHPVWTRCIDGVEVAPLAQEMTVRVIDRGEGRDYRGLTIRTVIISGLCPVCGGPRGAAQGHQFAEDGEWYTCDRWDNGCGHHDSYVAVLAQWRARPVPAPVHFAKARQGAGGGARRKGPKGMHLRGVKGGRYAAAVKFLAPLLEKKPAMQALAAALLLEEQGDREAARALRAFVGASITGPLTSARAGLLFLIQTDEADAVATVTTTDVPGEPK